MQLDKAIKERHCVRKFNSKKPDWRDIIECVDAARYAPMAGGNFTLKFVLVDDDKTIKKLADAAQQGFIADAKYVVVVCTNSSRTKNAYGERGEKYCRQQAGAAMQNFFLKIEEKKLATCWVGHFVDKLVREALKIPGDVDIEAMFPIGYEFKKRPLKSKIGLDNILYFNQYKNKQMKKKEKLDV